MDGVIAKVEGVGDCCYKCKIFIVEFDYSQLGTCTSYGCVCGTGHISALITATNQYMQLAVLRLVACSDNC